MLSQMFHDIGSADTKASIILAIAAAVASVIAAESPLTSISDGTGRVVLSGVLVCAYIFAIGSIACAVLAVLPRGRVLRWEKFRSMPLIRRISAYAHDPWSDRPELGTQITALSINHIDIAKYPSGADFLENFREHTTGLKVPEETEHGAIESALAQDIIRTARLSFVKHRWVMCSVVWLGLETTSFLLAAVIRMFLL